MAFADLDLPIIATTPKGWVDGILANFNGFLLDHASCEKKAAALAMSFVFKYPDRSAIIEPMIALAREELEHFRQVFQLMRKRALVLPDKDERDIYVNLFLEHLRHGRETRFLDKLVASGLIEARGCERFFIVSESLTDQNLREFYTALAKREAGHYRLFFNLAELYSPPDEVAEAVSRLSQKESEAMLATPMTHKLH